MRLMNHHHQHASRPYARCRRAVSIEANGGLWPCSALSNGSVETRRAPQYIHTYIYMIHRSYRVLHSAEEQQRASPGAHTQLSTVAGWTRREALRISLHARNHTGWPALGRRNTPLRCPPPTLGDASTRTVLCAQYYAHSIMAARESNSNIRTSKTYSNPTEGKSQRILP